MSKIVRHNMDEIKQMKLSADLKRLAEMPKSEIDTSEMPEWTEEQWARGLKRREDRWQREAAELQKKAS